MACRRQRARCGLTFFAPALWMRVDLGWGKGSGRRSPAMHGCGGGGHGVERPCLHLLCGCVRRGAGVHRAEGAHDEDDLGRGRECAGLGGGGDVCCWCGGTQESGADVLCVWGGGSNPQLMCCRCVVDVGVRRHLRRRSRNVLLRRRHGEDTGTQRRAAGNAAHPERPANGHDAKPAGVHKGRQEGECAGSPHHASWLAAVSKDEFGWMARLAAEECQGWAFDCMARLAAEECQGWAAVDETFGHHLAATG
eukprot:358052-Chlamydomonas_euryale.AAC.1